MGADLGRIGFVIAIVAVVATTIQQLVATFLPLMSTPLGLSAFYGISGVIHAVIAAAALVLGILGAQQRRSPVLSGVAIGVGGAGVVAAIIGLVVIPFTGLFF